MKFEKTKYYYRGNDKHIIIYDFIGKTRLTRIRRA